MTNSAFAGLEEIGAWQKAKQFVLEVYTVSAQGSFFQDALLRDQVRKECVTLLSHIEEGNRQGGGTKFSEALSLATKSIVEVRTQLYAAVDKGHFSTVTFDRLYALATDATRRIDELVSYLTQRAAP